jgi:GAF domain-containing protein
LAAITDATPERAGVASAAIFVVAEDSHALELAAASGVEGEALERLVAAVRDPAHPIARTVTDAAASFDVTPMAPGGPALRSHVPLLVEGSDPPRAVGVLAVAHEHTLNESERRVLIDLAEQAARLVATERG